jgi:hypothetical protein
MISIARLRSILQRALEDRPIIWDTLEQTANNIPVYGTHRRELPQDVA